MAGRDKDQRLYDDMAQLKRHLRECDGCRAALKCHDTLMLCHRGILMVLAAADGFDQIISLRLKAAKLKNGFVIACPDPAKHGKSYPMVAQPMVVTAFQERLL